MEHKYTATVHSRLNGAKLASVTFTCQEGWSVMEMARRQAGVDGIRNTQYLDVKNIKKLDQNEVKS